MTAEGNRARTRPPEVRFRQAYEVDSDGCWIWVGSVDNRGKPRFYMGLVDGRVRYIRPIRWLLEKRGEPLAPNLRLGTPICGKTLCILTEHAHPQTTSELMTGNLKLGRQRREKTACDNGHLFTTENTRLDVRKNGQITRACRECEKLRKRDVRRAATAQGNLAAIN